ncbi:MAG: Si-specific NAD(P)(+) transhydrogenase [Gimesia chilikensis]|uniref:Si-specific NAD(P)(+) transhydrogenase n=1 Tax=Gimesia chilikensis TaxID=2605989 RepID=UPI0011EC98D4|nr:Si-specific NAD(P)(+) transhydrogenase [Gimesia chilikensis]KAA0134556.1 Si-specific NAD(P)(+) transhydrogenase [Gimesia chilikensis]
MPKAHYDVAVIGTGPGGEGAAMQAIKQGKSVISIEKFVEIGGNCTHKGTIPSKALRYSILRMSEINGYMRQMGRAGMVFDLEFPELRKTAASVIQKQVGMRRMFYERNGVDLVEGEARFLDPHHIHIETPNGLTEEISFDYAVIATGSRPYRPADVDFSHPHIFCSDTILDLEFTPRSISVYGAGVIGCEYASMLRTMGMKVNLVNTRSSLLDFLDDEISDALSYHMRESGVLLRHCEHYESIEGTDDGVIMNLQSGKKLKTDIMLFAAGRTGNSEHLGLETLEIEPDSRGQIAVNDDFQTTQSHIYAVGDIIGYPSLASAAYVQGRYAASHLDNGECERALIRDIPTGIYTSPEISSLGKTERELTEAKIPYEVGHSMFKHLARAQIMNCPTGMLKLLFHRETLEILGIHCFGPNASEIIHIGQAIMSQPGEANTLLYFINTTFNYPTMAEAYRVAALNGYNRLF